MDHADRKDELEERIRRVDEHSPAPDDRAQVVWELLQKAAPGLTTWDVVCFAANYLGWQAENLPFLELPAKHICRLVYTAHYVSSTTEIDTGLKQNGRSRTQARPDDSGQHREAEPPSKLSGFDVSGGGFG